MYKILIVEDEIMTAKEAENALNNAFTDIYIKVVDCAEYALDELKKSIDDQYDLVIADLNLYDRGKGPLETSGFEMLKIISETYECNIMIRSASPVEKMAQYTVSMGLRGYVTKTGWSSRDLEKMIYEVKKLIAKKQTKVQKGRKLIYGKLTYSYDDNKWLCDGEQMELGKGYNELLCFFIENPGKLHTAEEILRFLEKNNANNQISDDSFGSISNRVFNRINQLRKKLEKYGYGKEDIIIASKRGGYYAKNLKF